MTITRDLHDRSAIESVEQAIAAIARGEFVVVLDDEDRENEGDLIMAAELATPASIAFMVRHTSGLICVALSGERLDELELPLMVADNTDALGTAFAVSVDYRHGTTTGISAADRAATIRAFCDPQVGPDDFARPGHVFPLRARPGGVLKRTGHTEAASDLATLAGIGSAGVLCEIVNDDGTMARRPQLSAFAARHGLIMISIDQLVAYRRRHERLVRPVSRARIPTTGGVCVAHAYESTLDGVEHVAVTLGDVSGSHPVLVRVHSECVTGDVLGSLRCDCGAQLQAAQEMIVAEGRGVIVYLRGHEGRGIGLGHKLRAYNLQDEGLDTVQANMALGLPVDNREYGIGAQILADLGVRAVRLLTNNPDKYRGLAGYGLQIVERLALQTPVTADNVRYLEAKRRKLGHTLDLAQPAGSPRSSPVDVCDCPSLAGV
jgi:3,4-dihydroxy 2-butanone 4-phosphate synthase/GTP cyclohydrolase II